MKDDSSKQKTTMSLLARAAEAVRDQAVASDEALRRSLRPRPLLSASIRLAASLSYLWATGSLLFLEWAGQLGAHDYLAAFRWLLSSFGGLTP